MKYKVDVISSVEVKLDESKFDEKFLKEYRDNFYNFYTIEDHAKHLAQMYVRELFDNQTKFIEGYGDPKVLGIRFEHMNQDEEITGTSNE